MKKVKHRFMTVNEVSDLLRCSIPTVYRYISNQSIPYIKQGHRVLFDKSDLEEWIEDRKIRPITDYSFQKYSNVS